MTQHGLYPNLIIIRLSAKLMSSFTRTLDQRLQNTASTPVKIKYTGQGM